MRSAPRCDATFTISSLYGLQAGIITETQFSLLVAVVVLSAVVPTVIAQRFLQPDAETERHNDERGPVPGVGADVTQAEEVMV